MKKKEFHVELFFTYYSFLSESFIISSRLAPGYSFKTAGTTLFTFALVKPRSTRAVVASSAAGFDCEAKSWDVSDPAPLTTLSFSSRISLWALFSPIPFMLFILFMSSAMIAFLISSLLRDESIILAVAAPIPDTPMRRRKRLRSSLLAKP